MTKGCRPLTTLKARHPSFLRFVEDGLVELVNDGNAEKDTSSGSDSSHEVSNDRKCTDAHATEGSGSGDVTVQNMNQRGVTVSLHHHLAVAQLLRDVAGRRS